MYSNVGSGDKGQETDENLETVTRPKDSTRKKVVFLCLKSLSLDTGLTRDVRRTDPVIVEGIKKVDLKRRKNGDGKI